MLYTVVPLDRIYNCRTESVMYNIGRKDNTTSSENNLEEYKNISLPHGNIQAKRVGDHYVVDSIYSSDMSDYLNTEYTPGTSIKM